MSRVYIVTGGAGFIGSNIASALAARGERVIVVDWLGNQDKWRNLATTELHDLITPTALFDFLVRTHEEIAAVIHMGAISDTTETNADLLLTLNVRYTFDLWEWCAAAHVPFLYASSAATYGDGSAGFEDDWSAKALAQLRPLNGYAWSKHIVDRRFSRDAIEGHPSPKSWFGLKFFNVYGPNEYHKGSMRSLVHQLYPKVVSGEPVKLFRSYRSDYRDGEQTRDFVYVKDCVRITLWLLDHAPPSGIYNVGSGHARTWLDLARSIFSACGRETAIEFIDAPPTIREHYQYFTEAPIHRLRAAGYSAPMFSLEDGVNDYINAHLSAKDPHL